MLQNLVNYQYLLDVYVFLLRGAKSRYLVPKYPILKMGQLLIKDKKGLVKIRFVQVDFRS